MSSSSRLAAVLAAAALTLTACGGGGGTGAASSTPSAESASRHDAADVRFAQDMIPHHAQAVVMAQMAKRQATTERVRTLAAAIAAAQDPEITRMSRWLRDWDERVPATDGGSMDDMSSGDGMMTGGQMSRLANASGARFDRLWLRLMVAHHTGAVAMAETEKQDGRNAEALALATRIVATQTAEVSRMKAWLSS